MASLSIRAFPGLTPLGETAAQPLNLKFLLVTTLPTGSGPNLVAFATALRIVQSQRNKVRAE
jgi:hypothetical protein